MARCLSYQTLLLVVSGLIHSSSEVALPTRDALNSSIETNKDYSESADQLAQLQANGPQLPSLKACDAKDIIPKGVGPLLTYECQIGMPGNESSLKLSIQIGTPFLLPEQGVAQKSLLATLETARNQASSLVKRTRDSFLSFSDGFDQFPSFSANAAMSKLFVETAPCPGNATAPLVRFPINQMRYSQLAKAVEGVANITRQYGNSTNNAGSGMVYLQPPDQEKSEAVWLGGWNMQYLPPGTPVIPHLNYTDFLTVSCSGYSQYALDSRPSTSLQTVAAS